MKKTNKKIDNQLCDALTRVCEITKSEVNGFQWLTHLVDYNYFPDSLSIICIFDTNIELNQARQDKKDEYISGLIKNELEKIDIKVKDVKRHIAYDTEEACRVENNGKWQARFRD